MPPSTTRPTHHGMSVATITGAALALVGFVLASVGAITGPLWWLVGVGAFLVVSGLVAGWALHVAGYGDR